MTEEIKHDKCSKCKCWRIPVQFLNDKGRKLKTCKQCRDVCKKSQMKNKCEHNKVKYRCRECGGASICGHNRRRSQCKECGGGSICEHKRERNYCKECGGSQICEHNRVKGKCKDCGGTQICEHKRLKDTCKDCEGSQICEHNKRRRVCKICDPQGNLTSNIRRRINSALKSDKKEKSIDYLGCTIEDFKSHIEKQFKEGMTWENYGEWHIDHITPVKYEKPTLEETIKRLHYTNTQPMWAKENIAKGNRFIG